MFSEISNVLMVFLTFPVTTCTAERNLSTLRCLKTSQSTMGQKRLNHVATLHRYQSLTELINIRAISNDFFKRNDLRLKTFAHF